MTVKYGQAEPTDWDSVGLTISNVCDRLQCAVAGFDNGDEGPAMSVVDEVSECLKVVKNEIDDLCKMSMVPILAQMHFTLTKECLGIVDRDGVSDLKFNIEAYVNAAVWKALQREDSPKKALDIYHRIYDFCKPQERLVGIRPLPESKDKKRPSNGKGKK